MRIAGHRGYSFGCEDFFAGLVGFGSDEAVPSVRGGLYGDEVGVALVGIVDFFLDGVEVW